MSIRAGFHDYQDLMRYRILHILLPGQEAPAPQAPPPESPPQQTPAPESSEGGTPETHPPAGT